MSSVANMFKYISQMPGVRGASGEINQRRTTPQTTPLPGAGVNVTGTTKPTPLPGAQGQAGDMMPPATIDPTTGQPIPPGAQGQAGDMMPPATIDPTTGQPATDNNTLAGIVAKFQEQANAANAANEERYGQGMGLYNQIIGAYGPGGGFGQGAMASYARGKEKALASGYQNLVSGGMQNTTMPAQLEKAYEEEVGSQFRTQLADLQMQQLTNALKEKAGFIERREDIAPDTGQMAGLISGAEAGPGGGQYDLTAGAGIGAGGGAGTGGGVSGVWGSGTIEPISSQQYKAESTRQQKLKSNENKVGTITKQIDNLKSKMEGLTEETDSKRLARLKKQLVIKEGKLKDAEGNVEKYSTTKAKISSASYATYQQEKQRLSRESEQQTKSIANQKYMEQVAADRAQAARNAAAVGSAGWGSWNL